MRRGEVKYQIMIQYKWVDEQEGRDLLNFLEELKDLVRSLPATGSLASAAIGKRLSNLIETRANKLNIPREEAVTCFFNMLKTDQAPWMQRSQKPGGSLISTFLLPPFL